MQLIELVLLKRVIFEWLSIAQTVAVVDHHQIYEVAFLEAGAVEASAGDPPQLILLLSFGNLYVEALDLVDDGRHRSVERREHLLVSMSAIYRLSSLTHYHEVLRVLVKLTQIVVCDVHVGAVLQCRIDFPRVKERLNPLMLCQCCRFLLDLCGLVFIILLVNF